MYARCRFDDNVVEASFISSTELICHTKAQVAGYVRVDVSVNGVDYSVSQTIFEFVDVSSVTGVVPYQGPTTGGTDLLIEGSSFFASRNLACNYGPRTMTSAHVRSSGEISCVSPADGN